MCIVIIRRKPMMSHVRNQPVQTGTATILLVEDDEAVRDVATELLEDAGYTVLQAEDAHAAMRVIESRPGIDLVFSDVRMPGKVDGVGLARWVRRLHPELLMVLVSGYVEPESLLRSTEVDAILQKPYTTKEVLRRLRDLLSRRNKRHGGSSFPGSSLAFAAG